MDKKTIINQQGFTVVEMLIAVSIFTIMIGIVMLVILTSNTTYHSANSRILCQEDLRRVLGIMIHELSEANQYRVNTATPTEVIFQIPIKVVDGGALDGRTVDEKNNIIFGARTIPTTIPDGDKGYAIRYYLVSNADISGSSRMMRQVLDAYPNGNPVGNSMTIATNIDSVTYSKNGKTLSINIATIKNNKFGRNIRTQTTFGVILRN